MKPSALCRAAKAVSSTTPAAPLTRAQDINTALAALRSEPSYAQRYRSLESANPVLLGSIGDTGSIIVHKAPPMSADPDAPLAASASFARSRGFSPAPTSRRAAPSSNPKSLLQPSQGGRGAFPSTTPPGASAPSSSSTRSALMTSAQASRPADQNGSSTAPSDRRGPPGDASRASVSPLHTSMSHVAGQGLIVLGNAGKGAVPGYGKRKAALVENVALAAEAPLARLRQADGGSEAHDRRLAEAYTHEYAPTSRSAKPMPHHTYFSHPSSAFNFGASPGANKILSQQGKHAAWGTSSAIHGLGSSSAAKQGHQGGAPRRKKTALIMPGQGSQYVAMCRDLYQAFRSARTVWHEAEEALVASKAVRFYGEGGGSGPCVDRAASEAQREAFERELEKSAAWDRKRGLTGAGTAIGRGRRGWLRDLVFSGDQLDLTRAENAQPAILVSTLSILAVLRKEFGLDLVAGHVDVAAGHGSGVYASLVASGALDLTDAVRALRHRGLVASHFVENNPVLFPEGCERPASIYEAWAFANAGSGKGAELLTTKNAQRSDGSASRSFNDEGAGSATTSSGQASEEQRRRGWKRSQMSGVMVRPGKLQAVLEEVARTSRDIREGRIEEVARDEVVEVANINSSLQVVLSGTRVGVSHASDRLRALGLGARAVNLPVSGPYHSTLMHGASEFLRPLVEHLPLSQPQGFDLVSSMDGSVLRSVEDVRRDLSGAMQRPVRWLDSIQTMLASGVERFVCLGPGRACAHLLSKELAYEDRMRAAKGQQPRNFEVWSVTTTHDLEQLGEMLNHLVVADAEGARDAASPSTAEALSAPQFVSV